MLWRLQYKEVKESHDVLSAIKSRRTIWAGIILQMREMRTVYRTWETSERGHLRDLGLDRRIIAKHLLEEQSVNI